MGLGCKTISMEPPILCRLPAGTPTSFRKKTIAFSSYAPDKGGGAVSTADTYTISFKTLGACKLGISRYPDFEYNAVGGTGTGTASKVDDDGAGELSVDFDIETLYIPPLTTSTTKFLGLPLPPFLKIDIVPQLFQGNINQDSGKVELEFLAKFCFSVGSVYKAPPLLVKTVLTSDESRGKIRGGRGERLDEEGKCKLVGVAFVEPIHDFFMDSFLSLPTECLAKLNAVITLSNSP
ncbi:pentatricopeptide repeat-containing protein [Hibiscus syriacus]|uniref:Pentatricopeptide repeat-containing protein n=1 Tax=Hibiscus syriacus TaxID=106335 RepID=A0A6A2Y2E5_HIBSY|nr:uncharacterized protein LOC120184210 [Hibiscus syriacus]KAE8664007.1 pentatricopeptide repeat-containing protein [Hibiscus syriacus]